MIDPLHDANLFQSTHSPTPLIPPLPDKQPSNHTISSTGRPHSYYKHLVQWEHSTIKKAASRIAQSIEDEDLHICSDGAFRQDINQGAHTWVFSTGKKEILWKGSGPSMGHLEAMTPYRAELCGLMACLYMLHWVCTMETVNCGKATLYCNNETALKEVFTTPQWPNNPYNKLQSDTDLITCARDLLVQLSARITIMKEWVKGHYSGPNRKLKHDLNDLADKLAGDFNPHKRIQSNDPPLLQPFYEAELIHQNSIVMSKLQQIIIKSLHTNPLLQYIAKSAKWEQSTLSKIDWKAHKGAIS
jgi:ribonuclease HI